MSGPDAAHILAVHPPVASPALEPLPISTQCAATTPHMPPVELYDANIDFYIEHLLQPAFLRQAIASVTTRDGRGDYHRADPAIQHQLTDLNTNRPRWEKRIAAVEQILDTCRSQQFYDPLDGVQALADLKALLCLISLAYFPARIGWGTFDHPQSHDPDWLAAFPPDTFSNPFAAYCVTRFAKKLEQPGLRLLLFWVVSRDQLPAVATLADFAKTTQPSLPVAAVGEADLISDCQPFIDPCLSICDDQLEKRLQQLASALADRKAP